VAPGHESGWLLARLAFATVEKEWRSLLKRVLSRIAAQSMAGEQPAARLRQAADASHFSKERLGASGAVRAASRAASLRDRRSNDELERQSREDFGLLQASLVSRRR
jgi:hypothetical protein